MSRVSCGGSCPASHPGQSRAHESAAQLESARDNQIAGHPQSLLAWGKDRSRVREHPVRGSNRMLALPPRPRRRSGTADGTVEQSSSTGCQRLPGLTVPPTVKRAWRRMLKNPQTGEHRGDVMQAQFGGFIKNSCDGAKHPLIHSAWLSGPLPEIRQEKKNPRKDRLL